MPEPPAQAPCGPIEPGDHGDAFDWSSNPQVQSARVTPDGRSLVFLSKRPLTEYDNKVQGAKGCELTEGSPRAIIFEFR